jgi:hypothetical protein
MTAAERKDVAAALRKEARKASGKSPVVRIFAGWKFGLSFGHVPLPVREVVERFKGSVSRRVGVPEPTYEELAVADAVSAATPALDRRWIFSASLHPCGRSSIEMDWDTLGKMLAAVGAPEGSCCTPPETTHPNAVHYWIWIEEESN